MPYIKQENRESLLRYPLTIADAGELNYSITKLIDVYVSLHGLKYETLNAIVGVLECAKAEFYRRVVAPYEDLKIQENGDVYQRRS